jgi:hypothetical protein
MTKLPAASSAAPDKDDDDDDDEEDDDDDDGESTPYLHASDLLLKYLAAFCLG